MTEKKGFDEGLYQKIKAYERIKIPEVEIVTCFGSVGKYEGEAVFATYLPKRPYGEGSQFRVWVGETPVGTDEHVDAWENSERGSYMVLSVSGLEGVVESFKDTFVAGWKKDYFG